MLTPLETARFLADPSIVPVVADYRVDLMATDVPTSGADRYVVATVEQSKNEVLIVKGIVPYAMRRTNIGTGGESFAMIPAAQGNGHFLFQPRVGQGGTPALIQVDLNRPRVEATPGDRAARLVDGGFDNIADNPLFEALRIWDNPMNTILVSAGSTLQVIFSLLPTAMPGRFQIGAGFNRVDFAGCYIVGLRMPAQLYGELFNDAVKKAGA